MILKFVGKQNGIEGIPLIPARDLTSADVRVLGLDVDELIATGLYVKVTPKKEGTKK